jgi:hypothetical protein
MQLPYYLKERCLYLRKAIQLRKLPWTSIDGKLMEVFLGTSIQEQERYSELFTYLVSGLLYYGTPDYAHIYYPGASSCHGAAIDAMEGFCRILPMISAWISSGRPSVIQDFDGQQIDLMKVAKAGLLAGTNPESKGFWGHICDRDQRIVEAADIALSVWLLRDHLWPQLSSQEKEMISNWLLSVNGRAVWDNNWHLFPVMVNEVLSSLDCDSDKVSSLMHYARLKSFYQGNGWFSDGPDGAIDYYNAWGIHYALFWINLINPKLDPNFIDTSLNDFVRNYKYFFSTIGFPITGRSICYRMAAPAPLIAAATKEMDGISSGMARRAFDCIWKYFIQRGAVRHGAITQGYWQEDLSLLDNYSGPGSSLWSTRSLTLAFFNPLHSDFWTAPLEDLPIERDNYSVFIPEIQWEVRGFKPTREVQIIKTNKTGILSREARELSFCHSLLVSVFRLPYRYRLKSIYARNELHKYSSLHPFFLGD